MNIPTPKQQVSVKQSPNNPMFLDVCVASHRAGEWVNTVRTHFEAVDRHDIQHRLYTPGRNKFYILVNPCYDIDEVISFLEAGPAGELLVNLEGEE